MLSMRKILLVIFILSAFIAKSNIIPDSLEITVSYTDIFCDEGASATVTVIGGTPPYSYLWSTGDTSSTIDSLWGAIYWVSVSDSSAGTWVTDTIGLDYYLNTVIYYDDSTHIAGCFLSK